MTRGKYIVIEGGDGTGKSTQVIALHDRLEQRGVKSIIVEEPGGVPIAQELRTIIKNGQLARDPRTDLLLFTAARRETWLQTIKPTLERGIWVLSDRNWLSTVAYQGYGHGVPIDDIVGHTRADVDPAYLQPGLMLVMALGNQAERARRIAQRGATETPDAFEQQPDDFQTRVQDGYVTYATQHGLSIIDAAPDIPAIAADIWSHVEPLLPS